MSESIFISLIHNVSLLLAMALVFDMISFRGIQGKASLRQTVPGLILSVIAVSVMLTPWQLSPGLVFDTRSIVTSMSGLFFGFIPTAIVVVSSSVVRYFQGGDGTVTGILVILSTGTAGIAWRHLSRKPLGSKSVTELYLFGITVHLIMLFMMFSLPKDLAFKVLPAIAAPVLLIYPAGTALLGILLINRIKREHKNQAMETSRNEFEKIVVEKELLMRELQHRVKNNLNIVSGIIRLGEINITEEHSRKIFTDARNRINAISSIYENLYQSSDISSIELHLYISSLADSLIATYSSGGGRISLVKELDRCSIELKRAVPLGLLVNELITNSIKYAFNGTDTGTITVKLKDNNGLLTVSVEDTGKGLPEGITTEDGGNMGLTLVRMLAEQIEGNLSFESGNGTRISFTFDLQKTL